MLGRKSLNTSPFGANRNCATADVHFGSEANVCSAIRDVRLHLVATAKTMPFNPKAAVHSGYC